jgi:hypothetical protein
MHTQVCASKSCSPGHCKYCLRQNSGTTPWPPTNVSAEAAVLKLHSPPHNSSCHNLFSKTQAKCFNSMTLKRSAHAQYQSPQTIDEQSNRNKHSHTSRCCAVWQHVGCVYVPSQAQLPLPACTACSNRRLHANFRAIQPSSCLAKDSVLPRLCAAVVVVLSVQAGPVHPPGVGL